MHVSPLVWGVTILGLIGVLLFDVLIIGRRPHVPSTKEAGGFVALYVALALAFAVGIWHFAGASFATEFLGGWVTEYALSVDNLFIFLIIMAQLQVPRKLQQYALMVGVIMALIFRFAFIMLGAAALEQWSWVFFVFGAILLYTGGHMSYEHFTKKSNEEGKNVIVEWASKHLPVTDSYQGTKSVIRQNGKWLLTPMCLVIVALGGTDVMFALDSIPAVFGFTQEAYLVFAATVFALMGLRQLYFLLGALVLKLVYLSLGLAVILSFIGVKLVFHAFHATGWDKVCGFTAPEISTGFSLIFILVTLVVTTVASLWPRKNTKSEESMLKSRTESPLSGSETELAAKSQTVADMKIKDVSTTHDANYCAGTTQ